MTDSRRPPALRSAARALSFAIPAACIFVPARARADAAVRVDVDPRGAARLVYAGGATPIPLASVAAKDVTQADVPIGYGRTVTHVRIAAEPNPWEALVAHDKVLFAGLTGYTKGEEGERTGDVVQILPRDGGGKNVLVGQVRQDRVICGQSATPLAPRVVDPVTMELRGATVQRLTPEQRKGAQRVVAADRGGPAPAPLARLLVAQGASTGSAAALTDGDASTAWTEERPGIGQGEFVTMVAPHEVPISSFVVTVMPPAPKDAAPASAPTNGAAPHTFYLVTEDRTLAVTMPNDAWMHPGEAYDVPLPEPLQARCVSLVLDSAYVRAPAPDVTVAELTALSTFDGPDATLEKVARALDGGGARADAAAAVLKRARGGVDAVRAVYNDLDAAGRALGMDVAASATDCAAGAPLLVAGLADKDREVTRKASEKLARCGKVAAPAMSDALKSGPSALRAAVAPLFADVAPQDALAPLADALGEPDAPTRAALRKALAHAARAADKSLLAALLGERARPADQRVELLRALAARLADVASEAGAAINELMAPGAPMRTRYLLAAPIAEMARAGDGGAAARLEQLLAKDPEPPVRTRAAEVAAGIAQLDGAIAAAADDPEPRVREAALRGIATAHARVGEAAATRRLASDPWTFVRVAAAGALAALPGGGDADRALTAALKDPAPRVRAAAVAALGAHGAKEAAPLLVERLADDKEDLEVRVGAAKALAATCSAAALEPLTKLVGPGASPVASEDERALGLAAIDALGRLHPPDLAARLAKTSASDANPYAKKAAERALAATDVCR